MITGARRLQPHHVTIRVPWHDGGWTGAVCARLLDNSSRLNLPPHRRGPGATTWRRVVPAGGSMNLAVPTCPCVGERVSFMGPVALTRTMTHPYTEFYPQDHGYFVPSRFVQPAYSAAPCPSDVLRGNAIGPLRSVSVVLLGVARVAAPGQPLPGARPQPRPCGRLRIPWWRTSSPSANSGPPHNRAAKGSSTTPTASR